MTSLSLRSHSGFTLIELAVSLAIGALLTPLIGGIIYAILFLPNRFQAQAQAQQDLQNTARWITEDANQAASFTSPSSTTTAIIASDGFESGGLSGGTGWNSSWSPSEGASVVGQSAHSGTDALQLLASAQVDRSLNLATATAPTLTFWARLAGFGLRDSAAVSVSSNGTSYTTLKSWARTDADGLYRQWTFDLSGFALTSSFHVRFQATSTAGSFDIDDVAVDEVGPATTSPGEYGRFTWTQTDGTGTAPVTAIYRYDASSTSLVRQEFIKEDLVSQVDVARHIATSSDIRITPASGAWQTTTSTGLPIYRPAKVVVTMTSTAPISRGHAVVLSDSFNASLRPQPAEAVAAPPPPAVTARWFALSNPPGDVGQGGALAAWNGELYALEGGASKGFWRYQPSVDRWTALSDPPFSAGDGAALAANGNALYALRGGGKRDFRRYDPSTGTWSKLANTPANVNSGGSLASDGSYLYAFRGGHHTDFWRYNPAADSWSRLPNAPGRVWPGGALVYAQGAIYAFLGNGSAAFWKYDPQTRTWIQLANAPGAVGSGAALTWTGGDQIDAVEGDGTPSFWSYSISAGQWTALPNAPQDVDSGGALASIGTAVYGLDGNNTAWFWTYQ